MGVIYNNYYNYKFGKWLHSYKFTKELASYTYITMSYMQLTVSYIKFCNNKLIADTMIADTMYGQGIITRYLATYVAIYVQKKANTIKKHKGKEWYIHT